MKSKKILTILLTAVFLSGCGTVEKEPASESESSSQTVIEETQSTTETLTDNIGLNDYENEHLKVLGNDEWAKGFSDDKIVIYHSIFDENASLIFESDDTGEYSSASSAAGEMKNDYCNFSNFELITGENISFSGYDAWHLLFLNNDNGYYYEYYFFDAEDDVIYSVSLIRPEDFYNEKQEIESKMIKNVEFKRGSVQSSKETEVSVDEFDFSIDEIIEANRSASVLEHFNSVRTEFEINGQKAVLYADNDFRCVEYDDYLEGMMGDRMCDYESGEFLTQINLGSQSVEVYDDIFLLGGMFGYNNITDVKEENGYYIVTASMNVLDSREFVELIECDVYDECTVVSEIKLRSDTLIIEDMVMNVVTVEETFEICHLSCSFNAEKTENMQKLSDHMNSSETREITLIVNPDEDNEYTISITGIKGDELIFTTKDDFLIDVYEDKECQTEYNMSTDSDKYSDLIIYGKEY